MLIPISPMRENYELLEEAVQRIVTADDEFRFADCQDDVGGLLDDYDDAIKTLVEEVYTLRSSVGVN